MIKSIGRACMRSALFWLTALAVTLMTASVAYATDASALERGRYLVNTIMACGNCHTPRNAHGQPVAGRELSGGGLTFELPPFAGTASNITQDRETGIGAWTDAEIGRAITQGMRPNHGRMAGVPLGLPMWVSFYKALTPSDLDAVVAYLRTVPAVRNEIPAPTYRSPVVRERYPDAEQGFTEEQLRDPVRRGAYLGTIGHCLECHTPMRQGVTQYGAAAGAGGRPYLPSIVKGFAASWTGSVSRNLSSHPQSGLGGWSDDEIKRAISAGIGRDGRALQPPMGFRWYAGLTDADLSALVAWLRTLPPVP